MQLKRAHYANECTIPVIHKLLVKKIVEGEDGQFTLVGTMIHHQVGSHSESQRFQFRFNDSTADDNATHVRRHEFIPEFGFRSTLNVEIPMIKKPILQYFPFNVSQLTAMVEMSTPTYVADDGREIIMRPSLMINCEEERDLAMIQDEEKLSSELKTVGVISSSPHIELTGEKREKTRLPKAMQDSLEKNQDLFYWPKYTISFYVEESAWSKLLRVYLPIVLVAILSWLNVVNNESKGETNDRLANSIAITLAVIFILPELKSSSAPAMGPFESNDWLIVTLFFGVILSSVTFPDAKGDSWTDDFKCASDPNCDGDTGDGLSEQAPFISCLGHLGNAMIAICLLSPILNSIYRYNIISMIASSSYMDDIKAKWWGRLCNNGKRGRKYFLKGEGKGIKYKTWNVVKKREAGVSTSQSVLGNLEVDILKKHITPRTEQPKGTPDMVHKDSWECTSQVQCVSCLICRSTSPVQVMQRRADSISMFRRWVVFTRTRLLER